MHEILRVTEAYVRKCVCVYFGTIEADEQVHEIPKIMINLNLESSHDKLN